MVKRVFKGIAHKPLSSSFWDYLIGFYFSGLYVKSGLPRGSGGSIIS